MTNLATKNGSLIVKDGKLAENCGCCNGLCSAIRTKATLTISGLPKACGAQLLDNRMIGDDDCSYPLFRVRNRYDTNLCKYATAWHSRNNLWGNFSADDANTIVIDVGNNTLTFWSDHYVVRFRPPHGKSFASFP